MKSFFSLFFPLLCLFDIFHDKKLKRRAGWVGINKVAQVRGEGKMR